MIERKEIAAKITSIKGGRWLAERQGSVGLVVFFHNNSKCYEQILRKVFIKGLRIKDFSLVIFWVLERL